MNRLDKKNFYQFPKYGFENILHENHFHPNKYKLFPKSDFEGRGEFS